MRSNNRLVSIGQRCKEELKMIQILIPSLSSDQLRLNLTVELVDSGKLEKTTVSMNQIRIFTHA
jgi:hypothetical protein